VKRTTPRSVCIVPSCTCEGRERRNWPMPDSPPSFSGDGIFDDAAFDALILAERTGYAYLRRPDLAAVTGLNERSIWTLVSRGTLPRPARLVVGDDGHEHAEWSIEQLAQMMQAASA
jgi:predicted DNA-binding transcriptional regulator AlpA